MFANIQPSSSYGVKYDKVYSDKGHKTSKEIEKKKGKEKRREKINKPKTKKSQAT